MRILVTGVAGFIGSSLAAALLDDGHEVVGLDAFVDSYPRPYKERNLRDLVDRPCFSWHELDLRTSPLDAVMEGIDAVVNEAAMPGLPRSWTDFDSYMTNNILAVDRLLEACRRAGVKRFLQASTSSVYGKNAVGDEELPTTPVSPYGVTKLAAEHLVIAHMRSFDLPSVIVRYFSVYGPRQRPDMAYHIFVEALLDGRPLTVFGDGCQTRSNTFITDCVQGTIGALLHGEPGEVYNLGGGETITLLGAIEVLAETLGVRPEIRHEPPRPGDQRDTRAVTARAAAAFGYRPTVAPSDGLRLQAEWHASLRR